MRLEATSCCLPIVAAITLVARKIAPVAALPNAHPGLELPSLPRHARRTSRDGSSHRSSREALDDQVNQPQASSPRACDPLYLRGDRAHSVAARRTRSVVACFIARFSCEQNSPAPEALCTREVPWATPIVCSSHIAGACATLGTCFGDRRTATLIRSSQARLYGAMTSRVIRSLSSVKSQPRSAVLPGKSPVMRPRTRTRSGASCSAPTISVV
jgi:hypothetical protein